MKKDNVRSFVLNLCVCAAVFALQLIVIWRLAPSPDQFAVTRSIFGTYQYDGGNARSRTHTQVDGRPIFCAVSFMGPLDSCGLRYLNGTRVRVEVADYRHLFGSGEIVVSIHSGNVEILARNDKKMTEDWLFDSLLSALLNTVFAGIAFSLFTKVRSTNKARS